MTIAESLPKMYQLRALADAEAIRAFLDRDPIYSAHAQCLLEQQIFSTPGAPAPDRCAWYLIGNRAGEHLALVMITRNGSAPLLFTMGHPEAIYHALAQAGPGLLDWRSPLASSHGKWPPFSAQGQNKKQIARSLNMLDGRNTLQCRCWQDISMAPMRTTFIMQSDHLRHLARLYRLSNRREILRMVVTPATFRPAALQRWAMPLERRHRAAVAWLYTLADNPLLAEDTFDTGVYYGIAEQGLLVAVASAHLIAEHARIAVVSNVFTHPGFRRRGYAQAVTGAVTAHLFEHLCQHRLDAQARVILDVVATNEPALAAYRRLGYQIENRFIEADGWHRGLVFARTSKQSTHMISMPALDQHRLATEG